MSTVNNSSVLRTRRSMRRLLQAMDLMYASGTIAARSGLNLDRSLHQVLLTLGEHESLRMAELADALTLTSPTVSRHVSRLVEMGIAMRVDDAADRRATNVTLTAAGQEAYLALVSAWDELFAEALGPIAAGTEEFLRGLGLFCDALWQIGSEELIVADG